MRLKMLEPTLINLTTENNRRSFVLLKVVPLRANAENGRTHTT